MQPLKKFSPESIRAIARNPNIDIQSIVIYSKSDIQHQMDIKDYIYLNGENTDHKIFHP